MEKLLETYILPALNYKETENLNRLITRNEIESVIKTLPVKKIPGPESFTGEFNQTFKEKLTSNLLKFFQKLKRR